MSVVGFDIGDENSYIAAVKSGGIEVIDNEYSLRSTPTCVAFTERSRDIGVSARTKLVTNLENTVFGFKRILGKKIEDFGVKEELAYIPHEISELPSGNIGIKVNYLKNNVVFSNEQLMAMMLTKLKRITESKLGNNIRECVIAVPVYYTDAQRRAMLDAVSISGLNALKLINESAAVVLSYGFFRQNLPEKEFQNVIFVDLGHSALTVTACGFTKDKAKILGCVWDAVGGRDFDNKLVQHFIDDFKARYQLDAKTSKKALMALMLECEMLKKVMSANSLEVNLQIECFLQDKDVSGKMKRACFEKLSLDVLKRIEITLHRILVETQLKHGDIHSVEIVGGSSRTPAVKQLIRKVLGREPNATLNQDEAVARGCALQCAMLSPLLKTRHFMLEDVPSYVIKIIWKNVKCEMEELKVFSFADKLPSSKWITISVSKPFSVEACYVECSSKLVKIGTFSFGNIPESVEDNGSITVRIEVCLNIHGIFSLDSAKMIEETDEVEKNNQLVPFENVNENRSEIPFPEKDDEENSILSPDQLSQDAQSSCLFESYDLAIQSDVPGLTRIRLDEYVNSEKQMIYRDIEEKEIADAHNALEEYIYDVRGKLHCELEAFILKKDKSALLNSLDETENWLYKDDYLEAAEYCKRLKELKETFDPIFRRFSEWEQIPAVMDRYQECLLQASDAINQCASIEKSTISLTEDVENLRKIYQNSKQYLDQSVEIFSKMNKTDEISVSLDDLKSSLKNFQTDFQKSLSELKSKIESAQDSTTDTLIGDGSSQNPEIPSPTSTPN